MSWNEDRIRRAMRRVGIDYDQLRYFRESLQPPRPTTPEPTDSEEQQR